MRRFSTFVKGSSSRPDEIDDVADNVSTTATTVRENESLTAPSLKVKRVDHYYSKWYKTWKYRNMDAKVTVETVPPQQAGVNDPWKEYSLVIVRKVPKQEHQEPTFKIVVKSEYIVKACKDVIRTWPGVSWNADPLELDPEMFLTFYDEFIAYRDNLSSKKERSEHDSYVLSSVSLLLSTLATDYRATLTKLANFKAHAEITFDLLYALLVPRTILVTSCAVTGNPRLFRLQTSQRVTIDGKSAYQLTCESYDMLDSMQTNKTMVGKTQTCFLIGSFKGTVDIRTLDAYPMRFHPDVEGLKARVLERGKRWKELKGIHHKQFNGIAASKLLGKVVKQSVNGRIMIDRATFRRLNPNYPFPVPAPAVISGTASGWGGPLVARGRSYSRSRSRSPPRLPTCYLPPPIPHIPVSYVPGSPPVMMSGYGNGNVVQTNTTSNEAEEDELSEEDTMLTSTVVYGFSLSDKLWLEFDIEKIEDVEWNDDAFANLVLPSSRKDLLRCLVEAHHRELGFDDFIKGKGHGLVINLFGPPGVGKTFSAEATSEHVRRPLYVIGGGDLGTKAADLDAALERVFDVATAWKAIVLIDEADVFLEQRSLHDLERNAMVAVFLRHVEYYRGILFLTTNRVQAFDPAFLSRIHVALHFKELTQESKEQVWTAFIRKLGIADAVTREQIQELAEWHINGRQIKNAARTAHSLAVGRGEKVTHKHFVETLEAMEEFTKEFEVLKKDYKV